jgi:hypothetical protein
LKSARREETNMEKNSRPIVWLLAVLLSVLSLMIAYVPRAAAQQPKVIGNAFSNTPTRFDVSPPLGSLVSLPAAPKSSLGPHAPLKPKLYGRGQASHSKNPAGATLIGEPVTATLGLGFAGVDEIDDALDCPAIIGHSPVPPDTNAAVGDSQVVQWVNECYAVFDKSTGALITGPLAGTNFWSGFGGPCEANNDGDPIIQWDKVNHRWLAAQNVFNSPGDNPPYFTCVAVSQTADATGSYFRYQFPQPGFPDYPKWGKKGNVYYQTQNNFGDNLSFVGVTVCAYQANLMLKGNSKAKQVCIVDDSNGTLFDDSMLPADDDSPGPSSPEVLLGAIDNFLPGDTHVYEYVFSVDFGNPKNSTLAGIDGSMPISVPAFDLAFCAPGGSLTTNCVPQPPPVNTLLVADTLDTLGDRLMYRLAHFSGSNGTQHYVVTHSVNDGAGAVGQRWYEFRAKGLGSTNLYLYQTGQTPEDGEYRWMGSAAMDNAGDIALGYSRSSANPGDYPSIYYAGQTAGDPLGTTESEVLIKQGGGSQINSFDRWGDYSSMALDGADSCTFWYTTEYYPTDGTRAWATWIASLKFPNCH